MSAAERLSVGGTQAEQERLADICRRYGVRELSVFGSVARGTEQLPSDVDVLFDLAPDARLGFGISSLQEELEEFFGREVDLLSKDSIHRLIRDAVLSEAKILYAA